MITLTVVILAGINLVTLFFVEKAPGEQVVAVLIALTIIVGAWLVELIGVSSAKLVFPLIVVVAAMWLVLVRNADLGLPFLLLLVAWVAYTQSRSASLVTLGLALVTIAAGVLVNATDGNVAWSGQISWLFAILAFWSLPQIIVAQQRQLGELHQAHAGLAEMAEDSALIRDQVGRAATLAERNRLARELHDSVMQSLFGVTLLAEAGGRRAGAGDLAQTQEYLERLREAALEASKDMRLLVYELGPLALEHQGLVGALRLRLDSVERRGGIDARLIADGVEKMPSPVEQCLYRIAQQALNNSLKHARQTAVEVVLIAEGTTIELSVADNGQGFDLGALPNRGGMGLGTMRERAELLGGTLTLESRPGHGTRVVARLPI